MWGGAGPKVPPSPGYRYYLTHQTAVPTPSSQVLHPYIPFRDNVCLSPCLLHPIREPVCSCPLASHSTLESFWVSYLLIQLGAHRPHSGFPSSSAPLLLPPGPVLSFCVTTSLLPHCFVSAAPALPWHAAKTPSPANFPPAQNPSEAHIPYSTPWLGRHPQP